jgi:hypothetical protein
MKQRPDGTYVSVDRPTLGICIGAFFAVLFLVWARSEYLSHRMDVWVVLLVLAFIGTVLLALSLPVTRFVFDPSKKLVTWSTRSALKRKAGQFSFDDVRNVVLQSSLDDHGYPTYRVAICTDREILPLSNAYYGNKSSEQLAKQIRTLFGMPADSLTDDSIAVLNATGRKIDAMVMEKDRR